MANQHKHPLLGLRGIERGLAVDFDEAAKRSGSDRSAVTRAFWEWFVGRPGAELPQRPADQDQAA